MESRLTGKKAHPAFPQNSPTRKKCMILLNTLLVLLFVTWLCFLLQVNSDPQCSTSNSQNSQQRKISESVFFVFWFFFPEASYNNPLPVPHSQHAPHPALLGFCRPLLCVLVRSPSWCDGVSCLLMEMDCNFA